MLMLIKRALKALRAKKESRGPATFLRSVGILAGGTALAQALTVLMLPVITRLYSPADFNVLAVYSSLLGIISVIACMRLEIAIPLPERDDDAVNLMVLSLYASTSVAFIVAAIVWIFPEKIASLTGQVSIEHFLWMLPLGVWFASAYGVIQYWTTRKKRFAIIAKTRVTQAIGGAGAQIGVSVCSGLGPFGLLLGQLVSSSAGVFELTRTMLLHDRALLKQVSFTRMKSVLRDYQRFPKYSTFEAFANSAGMQLPILVIAAMTVGPDAGYLLLAIKAMAIPTALIAGAVSQVYLSHAPVEMRAGRLADFTLKIIAGLAKSGAGPLIFGGIIAPTVFPLIFGKDWYRAGELVAWMTPWFVVQLLVTPVAMVLLVTSQQRVALGLQLVGLLIRVAAVVIAGRIAHYYAAEVFAMASMGFYVIYLCLILHLTGIKLGDFFNSLKPSVPIIGSWVLAGAALSIGISEIQP